MRAFGFHTTTDGAFDDVRGRVEAALKNDGFGVLTEIDVQATLKKKIDVDFRRYVILGACNPPFAHRALTANLDVGLMLPCNVVLYEEDGGRVHVGAIDPLETVAMQGGPALEELAREVHERLARVMARVAERA